MSNDDESEALLQFMYLAPVGLVQTTTDGTIVMINPLSAQLLMPLSRDGGLTNLFDVLEGVAPDLRHQLSLFEASKGLVCDADRIHLASKGRGRPEPEVLSLSLVKLDEHRLMAVLSDITAQIKRERQLRQSDVWFNAILTGISDYALLSLDRRGLVADWNVSVGRVTGFDRAGAQGRPYAIFSPEDATTPERILDRLREADENGWSLDDGWRVRADGSRFWGSAMIAPLYDRATLADPASTVQEGEPAYCLVIRDITDKREAAEAQRRATSCDHLTGIANRRAFFEAAELELDRWRRSPRPLSLVLFDVDHFKVVNDTHGHPAGDAVLRHFAERLVAAFRSIDVVARVGGEEFAVILPSTGLSVAQAMAERLRALVGEQVVEVDGVPIRYTVSGGVATMDGALTRLDELMKRADRALYAAKAAGRDRIECAHAG